jgi:hypothetical protein
MGDGKEEKLSTDDTDEEGGMVLDGVFVVV